MEAAMHDGQVSLRLPLDAATRLATAILKHADAMPSAALDLANLVRAANYAAHNDFAQPPGAWDPGAQAPPSV